MALHVQEYLRAGNTVESLETTLGINAKRHGRHPQLILFKYDQIESPMSNPIVQECRGLILDESDNWNIVNWSMSKFFNFGEGLADEIDWSAHPVVQEKVDGSLMQLYSYKGEWFVATSGTPDGKTEINGTGINFEDLFWKTLFEVQKSDWLGDSQETLDERKKYNFWFELTSPFNRVVVDHKTASLTLLGARRVDTREEVHPSTVAHLFPGLPVVKEFALQSLEDIVNTFNVMNPLEQEGYVIFWRKADGTLGRVKVKHPGYVVLHHARDSFAASIKNIVEVVRKNESAEYLAAFPDLYARFQEVQLKYHLVIIDLQEAMIKYNHLPVQKDFALAIKDVPGNAALFRLRAGKVKSIKEYLATMPLDSLMHLLGYK